MSNKGEHCVSKQRLNKKPHAQFEQQNQTLTTLNNKTNKEYIVLFIFSPAGLEHNHTDIWSNYVSISKSGASLIHNVHVLDRYAWISIFLLVLCSTH